MKLCMKLGRLLLILLVTTICILLFPTTIFAQEGGSDLTRQVVIPVPDQAPDAVKTTSSTNSVIEPEGAVPLTPEGNLTLVDDIKGQESVDKQFITVMTKAGKTFYIVIDRAGEKQNVYFMNLVDEADLMALVDDKNPLTGNTVKEKVVTTEPIQNEPVPKGPIKEPQTTKEPDTPIKRPTTEQESTNYIPVAATVILLIIGGVVWFTKLRKGKTNAKRNAGFDEYAFDDENETIDSQVTNGANKNADIQEDDGV